jgi:DNA-binding response OmpR family regulator
MLIMLSINGEILFYKKAKIKLTTNEFKMLEFLMKERCINKKNANYSELVRHIWGTRECVITLNTVSQLAYRLREKVKVINAPISIRISLNNHCQISFERKTILIILGAYLLQSKIMFIR